MRDRTWLQLLALYAGRWGDLAVALRTTKVSLRNLRFGEHRYPPLELIERYIAVLAECGTVDGSPVPNRPEMVRAWNRQFQSRGMARRKRRIKTGTG